MHDLAILIQRYSDDSVPKRNAAMIDEHEIALTSVLASRVTNAMKENSCGAVAEALVRAQVLTHDLASALIRLCKQFPLDSIRFAYQRSGSYFLFCDDQVGGGAAKRRQERAE